MFLNTLVGNLPPITIGILGTSVFLAIMVHIDPALELKVYLIKGKEAEIWRYFTTLLYMGKFNLNFLFHILLRYPLILIINLLAPQSSQG